MSLVFYRTHYMFFLYTTHYTTYTLHCSIILPRVLSYYHFESNLIVMLCFAVVVHYIFASIYVFGIL